jgi:hypothetical protein
MRSFVSSRFVVISGMILLAALSRVIPHPPNFAPITAMALFGAVNFDLKWKAFFVPLAAMFLSDLLLEALHSIGATPSHGLHSLMWIVYAIFALIVCMGFWLRRKFSVQRLAGTVLASSVAFFLLTNFAVWALSPDAAFPAGYPKTFAGLLQCYEMAIPFFQWTLLGDAVYSIMLFGGFALATAWFPHLRRQPLGWACLLFSAGLTLALGSVSRGQGGNSQAPWQPILPKEIYQELAKREVDIIRDRLSGEPSLKAIHRAKYGAVVIAALTMSVKEGIPPQELSDTRDAALSLAELLHQNGPLEAAQKLAATLPRPAAKPAKHWDKIDWVAYLKHPDLMDPFRPKAKNGDGIHADLQSNARLKGALNSVEDKVRALAMKELTPASIKTEARELELLGFRTSVAGALQYDNVPAPKGGKDFAEIWRKLSAQMRDHSVRLALAAQKGDSAAVFQAGKELNTSCNKCHDIVNLFRVK